MHRTTRQIGKNGVLRLLDEIESEGCAFIAYVSSDSLAERDYAHLLPDSDVEREAVSVALAEVGASETGAAVFVGAERTLVIQPPLPLSADMRASGAGVEPMRRLLSSEPTIGVILLRLGRYAVGVLRGERLLATKTDSRYMKNRHRAGGQSQRRFQRSRERLIRELYDKTCEIARATFGPYLDDMDYLILGGERHTLNGFAKRCQFVREGRARRLDRLLAVDTPNQKALEGISFEVWKSRVTFLER